MLWHVPKRVGLNVGYYNRRPAKCCRSARAGTRSDRQLFHLLPPSFGKTRARHGIQMKTIGAKQQNRSKRIGTVLLNNQTQGIQDFLQRNAGRDHLEQTLFTREQRLSSLTLADIYRGPRVMIDLPRLAEHGLSHALDMLNRSVRKSDSKFHVKAALFANCSVEILFNGCSIFRMNCFQE